tara:strand:- start:415 stop:1287 length:873 start_codon:yes stop_codon:yes gene_type:complete
MKLYKKYRVRILSLLNRIAIFNNFTISYYFSRFGNNLQQIGIGILYSNKKKGNFYSPEHELVNNFSVINSEINNYFSMFKKHYRFFYFSEKKDFPNQDIDNQYIKNNIENVFKENIAKNIKFLKDKNIDDDTLVIHIRSGDVFSVPIKDYYQNPINFYLQVIKEFKKTLVVTSHDMLNPICKELKGMKNVHFQSLSMEDDFNTLYSAKNLATSGAGTFPIAAALLSNKLENFYYTDLYLNEHLNPEMVKSKKVIHHKYRVEEGYSRKYLNEENVTSLILDKEIEVNKLEN